MARGAAKLALALGALLPGGARGQTYVGPEYIPAAEHPMPMWLSPPKEAAVASCAIDVGNAMVFLGQAGTSINEAVKKCDRQKTDTERAACSASVSGVLAGFGFAAGFLQLAAADCQSSFTVLKPAAIAQAACGADIANFVASLALLADAGSSIHNTCREEKGFKDVHKQSSWVQHRASELSGMAGIASSKLEKTMKDGKMVLHFSGASPGQLRVAMSFQPYSEEELGQIIQEIQNFCFPRRVRLKEFFVDFDPLRSGRCTGPHFARGLDMSGVSLTDREVDVLADHFTETGGRVQKPQNVNYSRFCEVIDEVFNTGDLNQRMTSSPSTTQMMGQSFMRNSVEDEERVMNLLHRVAMLCKTRGVVLKYCYTDHDRAPIASPSRVNPKTGGKVTKNQFIRNFPFKKDIGEKDLELLAERYRVGGPEGTSAGDVHFMALHNDISEAMQHEMPPFPRSDLFLKPDETEWSHQRLHPVQKIQSKVVERRVRLYEHFQDFDPLRKGVCTVGQVKTVFTMMNIAKEIDRLEFDTVAAAYMRDDGLFCYKDFCADIDRGFTVPNLEKDPLAQTTMPDASSTAPGRRNRITMTPSRIQKVHDLEDKIRSRIRKRGIYMKPAFQDMDRTNSGHVTRNQFSRVMHMSGFELDEVGIGLLCGAYCDLGNHNDFNYIDFLKSIDPPDEDTELAMDQQTAPHQEFQCSKYFDARGTVRPLDRMGSPLMA